MKPIISILGGTLLIALFSCQKEVNGSLPDGVHNDSIYLEKLLILDTTQAAPNDSSGMYKYIYDSRKRISKKFFFGWNGIRWDTLTRSEFFYTGADTLPYKAHLEPDQFADNVTAFYWYNNSGQMIRDSVLETTGRFTYVINFSYFPNFIKEQVSYTDVSGTITFVDTMYQTRVGRNILTQADSSLPLAAGYSEDWHYQYDNHPNPFKRLYPMNYPYYAGGEYIYESWGDNNFLVSFFERKEGDPVFFTVTKHNTYSYQYGSNGMPKIAWEHIVQWNEYYKYLFFYKD